MLEDNRIKVEQIIKEKEQLIERFANKEKNYLEIINSLESQVSKLEESDIQHLQALNFENEKRVHLLTETINAMNEKQSKERKNFNLLVSEMLVFN